MADEHFKITIDTHRFPCVLQENLIDLFDPDSRFAISDVKGAVVLLFLLFQQH